MFEVLVKMKLAERIKETDEYKILYHKKKLAFFVEKYVKLVTAKRRSIGRPRGRRRGRVIKDHPELFRL